MVTPPALTPARVAAQVCEGQARILFPKQNEVFYNPVQEFNRDLSIAAIQQFINLRRDEREMKKAAKLAREEGDGRHGNADGGEAAAAAALAAPAQHDDVTILEALSATGLRAVRYHKELTGVRCIVANDFSADAVAAIRRNVVYNGIDPETQVAPPRAMASCFDLGRP